MDALPPNTQYQIPEKLMKPPAVVYNLSADQYKELRGRSPLELMLAQAATINTDPVNREKAYQHWRKSDEAYNNGDLETSKSELGRAIKLDPTNSGYYNDLGVIFAAQQNFPRAVELYRRAITLDSGLKPITIYNLAKSLKFWAKREVDNKNYPQARALFEESRDYYLKFLQVGKSPDEVITSQNSITSIDTELGKLPKT